MPRQSPEPAAHFRRLLAPADRRILTHSLERGERLALQERLEMRKIDRRIISERAPILRIGRIGLENLLGEWLQHEGTPIAMRPEHRLRHRCRSSHCAPCEVRAW